MVSAAPYRDNVAAKNAWLQAHPRCGHQLDESGPLWEHVFTGPSGNVLARHRDLGIALERAKRELAAGDEAKR